MLRFSLAMKVDLNRSVENVSNNISPRFGGAPVGL